MGRSLSTPGSGRLDPSPVHIGRAGQDSGYEPPSPVCPRPFDVSSQGYNNWIFMSTHFWDEDPRGLWILGLENKGYYFNTGEVRPGAGWSSTPTTLQTGAQGLFSCPPSPTSQGSCWSPGRD